MWAPRKTSVMHSQGGFNITPQKPFSGVHSRDDFQPGIVAFPFYKWLQRLLFPKLDKKLHKALQCYEIFVVHVAMVPTRFALNHCRKLAAKLWEGTGAGNTSASLL